MLSNKGAIKQSFLRDNRAKLGPNAVQELKINQRRILIDSLEIGIPAPEQMIALGERQLPNGVKVGQLLNSKTLNYKKFTPHRDGLFCERIFGPVQSFVCACGKKKESVQGKNKQKEIVKKDGLTAITTVGEGETTPGIKRSALFCPKCQVEYISKDVRRHRLGYIKLFAPVTHIWYLKSRPSYLSLFLGKRKKAVTSLAYCNAFLVEQVYSALELGAPNVLKNATKSITDSLEKSNTKRQQKLIVSDLSRVTLLAKANSRLNKNIVKRTSSAVLLTPEWYKSYTTLTNQIHFSNCGEKPFLSLLVQLFPETHRHNYNVANLTLSFAAKESVDQEAKKVKQTSINFPEVCISEGLSKNQVFGPPFFTDSYREKEFLLTPYNRAQTLPFLPSLICSFHLRDSLISFLQSLPSREDVPIPFYCQTPRRYPLRDVHKFLTEFRSTEATNQTERVTSESINRLRESPKERELSVTSYYKERGLPTLVRQGKDIKPLLKWRLAKLNGGCRTLFGKSKDKSKESKKASPLYAPERNKALLPSSIFDDEKPPKNEVFLRYHKEKIANKTFWSSSPAPFKRLPFGALNTFTKLKVRTFTVHTNEESKKAKRFHALDTTQKQGLPKSFAFAKAVLAKAVLLQAFARIPSFLHSTRNDIRMSSVAALSKRDLIRVEQNTPFFTSLKGNKKFAHLYLPTLVYVSGLHARTKIKGSQSIYTRYGALPKQKVLLSQNVQKELQKRGVACKSEGFAITPVQKLLLAKPSLLQAQQCIPQQPIAEILQPSLLHVSQREEQKCNTYYGSTGVKYQLNHKNPYKSIFNNNLLDLLFEKKVYTYQARLLYMVFGALDQVIDFNSKDLHKRSFCKTEGFARTAYKNEPVQKLRFCKHGKTFGFAQVRFCKSEAFARNGQPSLLEAMSARKSRSFASFGSALLQVPAHQGYEVTDTGKSLAPSVQERDTSPSLLTFTQAIKSSDICSISLWINCSFFVSGCKRNTIFFITKKTRDVQWMREETRSELIESSTVQTDQSSNKIPFIATSLPDRNVSSCVLIKRFMLNEERAFTDHSSYVYPKAWVYANEGFAKASVLHAMQAQHRTALPLFSKGTQVHISRRLYKVCVNQVERNGANNKSKQKRCITRDVQNPKRASKKAYAKRQTTVLPVMKSTSILPVRKRTFIPVLFTSSLLRKLISCRDVHHFVQTSSTCIAYKNEGNAVLAKAQLLQKQCTQTQHFTKTWFSEGYTNVLGTHSNNLFSKKFTQAEEALKTKLDQVKRFTDTDHILSKNGQASFGSEMISKWHIDGAKEILLYTGGGALESLLKRFNISLFYEFLFSEIQILRRYYKDQMFLIATYNSNQKTEKQGFTILHANQANQSKPFALNSVSSKPENSDLPKKDVFYSSKAGLKSKYTNFQRATKTNSLRVVHTKTPFLDAKDSGACKNEPVQKRSFCNASKTFGFGQAKLLRAKPTVLQAFNVSRPRLDIIKNTIKSSALGLHDIEKEREERSFIPESEFYSHEDALRFKHKQRVNFQESESLLINEKGANLFCRRIYRTTRRLKIVQLLMRSQRRPEWMMISVLPVLPPDLRPVLQMGEDLIVASDLNTLYQRVIYRNNRHYKGRFLDFHFVSSIHRLVQDAVDRLIENGKGGSTPFLTPGGRPLKSLSDILKGKRGRFRFNLLGKRVDFSGRSVIVVSPKLKIHECGLPREMALELYKYLLIRQLLLKKKVSSIVNAKKAIKERKPFIWDMLREMIYVHPLLLNRAPTLHRLGIQAFQPKLTLGNAILLHPLVCAGFNADFDGDQMGVHLPLSPQARAEAWDLLWSRNNLLSPATGQPILLPSQDMVLGFYYMTALLPSGTVFTPLREDKSRGFFASTEKSTFVHPKTDNRLIRKNEGYTETQLYKNNVFVPDGVKSQIALPVIHVFSDRFQVVHAYQKKEIDVHTPIWYKWVGKAENGEKHQVPLEVRLDTFGYQTQIYPTYKYKSKLCNEIKHSFLAFNENQRSIHIRTTVGRVLVNNLLSKNALSSPLPKLNNTFGTTRRG